uniref:Uncharacterized protein n=1 Tax=Glossina palpalis gambiensis TaxID=67801 RepID=A0A1B0BNW9_9MUSC
MNLRNRKCGLPLRIAARKSSIGVKLSAFPCAVQEHAQSKFVADQKSAFNISQPPLSTQRSKESNVATKENTNWNKLLDVLLKANERQHNNNNLFICFVSKTMLYREGNLWCTHIEIYTQQHIQTKLLFAGRKNYQILNNSSNTVKSSAIVINSPLKVIIIPNIITIAMVFVIGFISNRYCSSSDSANNKHWHLV